MILKQLFEPDSCSYTYLLGCQETGKAALIDPVLETVERDLSIIRDIGLQLSHTIETHVHADHITGAGKLRSLTGCKVAYPEMAEIPCSNLKIRDEKILTIGSISLLPIFTPGHTDHHFSYLYSNATTPIVFTGDALLIDACGRTDFQSGDAETLFTSIQEKLFCLPDETLIYPGHDYEGRCISTISQEKMRNPRVGNDKGLEEFVDIMNNLNLPYPKKIDVALPSNEKCGLSAA